MVFKFDPNSSEKEGRWRLRDPDSFVNDKYIRKNFSTGIGYILGKLKSDPEGKFVVQAIRFKKDLWDEKKAAEWWKKNKDKYVKIWKEKDWKKIPLDKPTVKQGLSKAKKIAQLLNIDYVNPFPPNYLLYLNLLVTSLNDLWKRIHCVLWRRYYT